MIYDPVDVRISVSTSVRSDRRGPDSPDPPPGSATDCPSHPVSFKNFWFISGHSDETRNGLASGQPVISDGEPNKPRGNFSLCPALKVIFGVTRKPVTTEKTHKKLITMLLELKYFRLDLHNIT